MPPHKTLLGVPKNKGLPIGNLNSQFFANVYLGERKLIRRYLLPDGACRALQQYRYYRRNFSESVLLFQMGRFFEFYERRDEPVALALKPMRRNGRGARYGFPVGALRLYLPRLLKSGRSAMVIAERDEYLTEIRIAGRTLPSAQIHPHWRARLHKACGDAGLFCSRTGLVATDQGMIYDQSKIGEQ